MMAHYEPGRYKVKVTGQRFGTTPTKKDYFCLDIVPLEALGEHELPVTIYPRELTFYLSEAAAPYSIDHLRRMGWEGESFEELNPLNPNHLSLAGTILEVECEISDKGYDRWNMPLPQMERVVTSDRSVPARLDSLFAKALKATKPKKEVSAPPVGELPAGKEEIPF